MMPVKNLMSAGGEAIIHEVVVVAFDMCSSSKLIDDLMRTENLKQYDRLLKGLNLWLRIKSGTYGYVVYKFTGDGWILLFPAAGTTGEKIMRFLSELSSRYHAFRKQHVDGHLESVPASVGLTFGMEMGRVRRLLFNKDVEFVGRVLNVACRLQAAVKDRGSGPDYRCLLSRRVYNTYMTELRKYKFGPAERSLRNISGGERYQCYKVDLSP